MKISHTVKFPFGRQYEMHEFTIEVDDAEFPEFDGLPVVDKARYMEGFLLQQGLIIQVGSGYLDPATPEFKESWRLASELKGRKPAMRGGIKQPDARVQMRNTS
jgi:hypothetical protein